jgi:hypothetical protein
MTGSIVRGVVVAAVMLVPATAGLAHGLHAEAEGAAHVLVHLLQLGAVGLIALALGWGALKFFRRHR